MKNFFAREPSPEYTSKDSPEWLPCSTAKVLPVDNMSINNLEDCVTKQCQVNYIPSGKYEVPYSSHASLLEIQKADTDLVQVRKYLSEGLTPSYEKTPKDILRYMNCASLSNIPNDDLIVVKEILPFHKQNHRIIIPRNKASELITAMHFELNHPSVHQLQSAFTRSFFTLDMHRIVIDVVNSCQKCNCLKMHNPSYNDKDITQTHIPWRPNSPPKYRNIQQSFRPSTRPRKTFFRFKGYDCSSDPSSYGSVHTTDEPYVISRTFKRKKEKKEERKRLRHNYHDDNIMINK